MKTVAKKPDMDVTWAKNYSWCELGDLTKDVTWIRATLDRGWTFDMPRNATSILSGDLKVLTIFGNTTTSVTVQIAGQSIVVQGLSNISLTAGDFLFV